MFLKQGDTLVRWHRQYTRTEWYDLSTQYSPLQSSVLTTLDLVVKVCTSCRKKSMLPFTACVQQAV